MEKIQAIRVLVVEDSVDDAELLVLELERGGFDVDCHRVDSADALRTALLTHQWDIIISDFAMPSFNGLEAFELVKSLAADTPFIFVSGAIGEERAVEAMRAGARDYLLKDNLTRLSEAVRREVEEGVSRRERRRAEERALREARRLAMAVEASGAGIFEHRVPAERDSYQSERWAEILGFRLDELPLAQEVSSWFEKRIHPEDRDDYARAYADFIAGERERLEIETRVAHKLGHWVSVALLCKPLARDSTGRATQVGGVMLDLTQRRRLEDQLRQAQKMEAVGRLAGGVAHDFNNLLTVIYSFGGFVLDELPEGSRAESDMQEVLKAAQRAAGLTRQLLAFSRRQSVEPRVLNLNQLLAGTEKMLRRVLGEDVDFSVHFAPQLGNTRVDPGAFEQVLLNLAINARDAMPEGGKLTIETFDQDFDEPYRSEFGVHVPRGRYVGVAVTDDGTGMSQETLRQIFEPFFTTKEPGKGTGLGMSTCYGIIKQANGHILVYSELGSGTTVRVLLPRVFERSETLEERSPPSTLHGSETVLIAEDDEQVRRLCVRALSEQGYHVLEAAHGEQALGIGLEAGRKIDLLLTDVVMPSISGKQLSLQLRTIHPTMKVLYMSGYTANAMTHQGILEVDMTLLQKPFTPEHLLRSIRALLDQ